MNNRTDSKVLGLVEVVIFRDKNGHAVEIQAKVDTGADYTSIDESLAIQLGLGPIVDTKKIKSSHGVSVRPVVESRFELRNMSIEIKANLTNRDHLRYPMLIGKDIMKKYGFMVNPDQEPKVMINKAPLSDYTAALISQGSKSSLWTIEEMSKYFKRVDNLNLKSIEIRLDPTNPVIYYEGAPLQKYDCVYVKGSFRFAQVMETITRFLHKEAYMPISPESFSIVHDKLATHLVLQENNMPMPGTYFASSSEAAKKLLRSLNYPIILKFPKGTQGKGVMFADSFASANTILDALVSLKQPFIIQEFIATAGEDIRVIVIGNEIAAAMKRKSVDGDIRSNIHQGGYGEKLKLDSKTTAVCLKAAKILKADICAIDLLEGARGPLIIEANISPGLQGITKATQTNVAAKIAKFLYEKTVEFKREKKTGDTSKLFEELGLSNKGKNDSIITQLNMRGNSIVLPELILKKAKFLDGEEVDIHFDDGLISLKRFLKSKNNEL